MNVSPDIDTNIKQLQIQVDKYSKYDVNNPVKIEKPSFLSSFKFKNIYFAIPISIFIVLLYSQPQFVKYEKTQENGTVTYHLGFFKVIMWTLVLSICIALGIFGYYYKKEQ